MTPLSVALRGFGYGALAVALIGLTPNVQVQQPSSGGGGAGQVGHVSAKQAVQRIHPLDLRGTVYAKAPPVKPELKSTFSVLRETPGPSLEQGGQPAKFAQTPRKTGVNTPETAHKAQVAPDFEAALKAQVAAQFEAAKTEIDRLTAMADQDAALAMLAFMMADDA